MSAAEIANKTQAMALFVAANPPVALKRVGVSAIARVSAGLFRLTLDQAAQPYSAGPPVTGPNVGITTQVNGAPGSFVSYGTVDTDGTVLVLFADDTGAPADPTVPVYVEVSRFPSIDG